jgi:transposase-like protein
VAIILDDHGRAVEVRWSARRKARVVIMGLERPAERESIAAEHGVSIERLLRWTERFLQGGTSALKGMA